MFGVYGSSGFGREVMPIARAELHSRGYSQSQITEQLVFIDDFKAKSIEEA